MREDHYNYTGNSPQDNWVKIYDDFYRKNHQSLPSEWLSWKTDFQDFPVTENICVQIISQDSNIINLPESVSDAGDKIRYLSAPTLVKI